MIKTVRNPKKHKTARIVFLQFFTWPVRLLIFLLLHMPEPLIKTTAEFAGWLFWNFGSYWKKQALDNLKIVYKDTLTEKEMREIAAESMKNIPKIILELIFIMRVGPQTLDKTVVSGKEYLEDAAGDGKGVLILGSHIGNFMFLITALTYMGYPVSYIYKEPKDELFGKIIDDFQEKFNLNPIPLSPRNIAIKKAFIALRKKEVLWLAIDQDTREGGIGVEFFGVKVSTPQGPAVLAGKTGATVLPVYAKRHGWMKHEIIIKPPLALVSTGDKEADKYVNLKRMNEVIEQILLDNPGEWWWIHRRWKRAHRYR